METEILNDIAWVAPVIRSARRGTGLMKVIAFEGIVENGCVRLPARMALPDGTKVYVVVPDVPEGESTRVVHIRSPRLAHPEQASDFFKMVVDVEEKTDGES
jgi:hypothetical protein